MIGYENHADDVESGGTETTLRFVMTLIVTTAMVAMTAYVLSFALLTPGETGASHGQSATALHLRS